MASLIPDAFLVPLDSKNHLTLVDEPAWEKLIGNVRHFLTFGVPIPELPNQSEGREGQAGLLTRREIDVLKLISEGRSNQEIALELVISFNTVTNHVKNIFDKTGSSNRTEAANFAFRHGLVTRSRP